MATASWPAGLPPPSTDYGYAPQSALARTSFEGGNTRQRRRFTQVHTVFPVSWVMSRAQVSVFEAWFAHEIQDGAAWFEMELLTGDNFEVRDCRFIASGEPYQVSYLGPNHYRISATLEARRIVLLAEDLDGILSLAPESSSDFQAAEAELDLIVNTTMPVAAGW